MEAGRASSRLLTPRARSFASGKRDQGRYFQPDLVDSVEVLRRCCSHQQRCCLQCFGESFRCCGCCSLCGCGCGCDGRLSYAQAASESRFAFQFAGAERQRSLLRLLHQIGHPHCLTQEQVVRCQSSLPQRDQNSELQCDPCWSCGKSAFVESATG